jgi:hypothetical protein
LKAAADTIELLSATLTAAFSGLPWPRTSFLLYKKGSVSEAKVSGGVAAVLDGGGGGERGFSAVLGGGGGSCF